MLSTSLHCCYFYGQQLRVPLWKPANWFVCCALPSFIVHHFLVYSALSSRLCHICICRSRWMYIKGLHKYQTDSTIQIRKPVGPFDQVVLFVLDFFKRIRLCHSKKITDSVCSTPWKVHCIFLSRQAEVCQSSRSSLFYESPIFE